MGNTESNMVEERMEDEYLPNPHTGKKLSLVEEDKQKGKITFAESSVNKVEEKEKIVFTEHRKMTKAEFLRSVDYYIPYRQFQGHDEARLTAIVDGDTLRCIVIKEEGDKMIPYEINVRVLGCDTPEKVGDTKEAGIEATRKTYEFFGIGDEIFAKRPPMRSTERFRKTIMDLNIIFDLDYLEIKTLSDGEKFGRMLANVTYKGQSLAKCHISSGNAYEYHGDTKDQSKYVKKQTK